MIIVSGFNVFPSELEKGIALCPAVVESAAIGSADEKQGEVIKIFMVNFAMHFPKKMLEKSSGGHSVQSPEPNQAVFF